MILATEKFQTSLSEPLLCIFRFLFIPPFLYLIPDVKDSVGMSLDEMTGVNGHVNRLTARIYLRNSAPKMAKHGAKIQGAATGLPVTDMPDFSYVVLRDGTRVTPRSVMTTTETGQGIINVLEQQQIEQVLVVTQDVTQSMRLYLILDIIFKINLNFS